MNCKYFLLVCLLQLKNCLSEDNNTEELPTEYMGKGFLDYFMGNRPKFCNCECGKAVYPAGTSSGRILGGLTVGDHEYPWLVIVNIQGITTSTGTLLNERYVITSASQMLGLTPYDVKVTVGAYDRCFPDKTSSNHSVDSIIIHPNYDPLTRANDLALLRISNIIVTDRWTSPICLPRPGSKYEAQVVQMVGWGSGPTAEGTTVSSCRPRRVGLAVLSARDCLYLVGDVSRVTEDKACTGTGGTETVICSTDAGGPVQHLAQDGYFELVGVLSDTNVCSTSGSSVTVFTRLNLHFSWLFQNTRDSCYCTKL